MAVVYDQDWESLALTTPLTDTPPSYMVGGSSGAWTVVAGLSGNSAGNLTIGGANWAHAMYNGASYTYTDYSVRALRGGRANIFARVTALSGVNSIPSDGYQIQVISGSVILYKGGYATTLGTWVGNPSNINDFTVRLLCNGTSIKVFVDGTERISVTDATYASGKVGIGTFGSSTTRFDDITVDNGTVVGSLLRSAAMMRRRRRQ